MRLQQYIPRAHEVASRWGLQLGAPFADLSYHYVVEATRGNDDLVLKVSDPGPELVSEIAALRVFAGPACVELLDANAELGSLLLRRVRPGTLLAEIKDDDRAISVAAQMMTALWRPAPLDHGFRSIECWCRGLHEYPADGPLPTALVERARATLHDLGGGAGATLVHADLHQFNIIRGASDWVVIDPKGGVGDPGFELGPVVRNLLLDCDDPASRLARRVERLARELTMDATRVLQWAFVHAVLSCCWSLEDGEPVGEDALRCAYLMTDALGLDLDHEASNLPFSGL